jgi:hypothetical protein
MMLLGGQKVAKPIGAADTLPDTITHDTLKRLQEDTLPIMPAVDASLDTADSGVANMPDDHANDQKVIEQQAVTDEVTEAAHLKTESVLRSIGKIIPGEEDASIDAMAPVKEVKGERVFKAKSRSRGSPPNFLGKVQ